MDITSLILIAMFGMVSIMPLLRIDVWGRVKRYHRFILVNLVLVGWSFMMFLQLFTNPHHAPWLYQNNHLVLMEFVFFFFFAVRFYRKGHASMILILPFILMLMFDISIRLVIPTSETFMAVSSIEGLGHLTDHSSLSVRFFFVIEAIMISSLFVYTIGSLLVDDYHRYKKDASLIYPIIHILSYITCLFIVVFGTDGLLFGLDVLYLSSVVLASSLYVSFFLGDPLMNMRANNCRFILDMIDQMYVITDVEEKVIHVSKTFKQRFDIEERPCSLSRLIKAIKKDAVLLKKNETNDYFDKKKSYYTYKKKMITFPFSVKRGFLFLLKDITRSRRMSYEMDYVMNHDLMTGLYNRNYFESIKPHIERHNETYALILMDLDGLKVYNDILGHKAGDRLIKRFASAMTNIAEKYRNTLTIRLGGDEFLLLPQHKSSKEIQHMITDLKQLCHSRNTEENIVFSYGIEYKTTDTDESISTLLGMADEHLYIMKDNHKKKKEELRHFLLKENTKPTSKPHKFN